MKLIHPEIETVFCFGEGVFHSIVIENVDFFYRFVGDLFRQCCGEDGPAVLSIDDEPVALSGNLDLLTNFFPFEINRKILVNKITAKLEKSALSSDFFERSQNLVAHVEKLVYDLAFQNDLEVQLPHLSISSLIKSSGVCLNEDYSSLAEKLLVYMDLMTANDLARLFVLVNVRSLLNHREMEELVCSCCRKGFKILLVDNKPYAELSRERRTVIDSDLCEI